MNLTLVFVNLITNLVAAYNLYRAYQALKKLDLERKSLEALQLRIEQDRAGLNLQQRKINAQLSQQVLSPIQLLAVARERVMEKHYRALAVNDGNSAVAFRNVFWDITEASEQLQAALNYESYRAEHGQ